ncbi:MAG: EVE domain-containing protein [Patescibacteria group bacterium]|nr:EVE domain-containing protein [Patescibacteria group bacterium]
MNVFVFQSVPERYDLREAISPGAKDTWYATRYRNKMNPGDLVFFWMAGDEHFRGLYGWGKIISTPYLKSGWESHGVDVSYEVRFYDGLQLIILTNGFQKKSQKTPKREIELAKSRKQNYLKRRKKDG